MFKYVFFLRMHPRVLKNSKRLFVIRCRGGKIRPGMTASDAATAFMEEAKASIAAVQGPPSPITVEVNARMVFYGAWGAEGAIPDLSNLYQGPEDALQAAGVLADDSLVASHDGSRRVRLCPTCPLRKRVARGPRKGQWLDSCGAKKKCPYAGVRIELTPVDQAAETAALANGRFHEGEPVDLDM